jgi:SAM-dependent methyltransferase
MSSIKEFLKRLSSLGIEINFALDSGLSFAGMNLSRSRHGYAARSQEALERCLKLKPGTVLDVGSGGGHHAASFASGGASVTCIDFGTSVYAKEANSADGVRVFHVDFAFWQPDMQYEMVWASHVLEHQRNVGAFIEKLVSCCAADGKVIVTVPTPHRRLWGGHLTLWTPGLLAYNIVMCGIDLSDAELFYGYREISIIFRPRRITLPSLTFDSGDLDALRPYLPKGFGENSDAWF